MIDDILDVALDVVLWRSSERSWVWSLLLTLVLLGGIVAAIVLLT